MTYYPYKRNVALWYAFLLWIFGFVWGTIVFMIPALEGIASVPHVSKYPAVSVPLILFYLAALYLLTQMYLKETGDKAMEGLNFGLTIFFVNIILDALVYVLLFKSHDYFYYASIWISYALFVVEPWWVGKKLERREGA